MFTSMLRAAGFRSSHLQALSMGSVGLCIALWIRAKTVDQSERGNAERRALFVGLWPPTFWLIGDSLERRERKRGRRRRTNQMQVSRITRQALAQMRDAAAG